MRKLPVVGAGIFQYYLCAVGRCIPSSKPPVNGTFVGRSAIKTQTRRVDELKPPVPTADVNRKRTK